MSKLYFRYGAMNSGKSTILMQVAHNYEERGMKVLLIKPMIDTKGSDNVVSRLGIQRKVDIMLSKRDNVYKLVKNVDAVIVDEAQFLKPKQVDELWRVTKEKDIPVLCYGLRCDFLMHGFPGATRLLEIADTIEEIKTICRCGRKATQNLRKINGKPVFRGSQVAIDDSSEISYESVCGKCYIELRENSR